MATPTAYNNGALVTSTTTETGFTIKGDMPPGVVTICCTLRSGSLQATVQPQETVFSPVIAAGSYTTWTNSTAGQQDKFFLTLDPVNSEGRMLGTATFSINW